MGIVFQGAALSGLPMSLPSLAVSATVNHPPCGFSGYVFSGKVSSVHPPRHRIPHVYRRVVGDHASSSPALVPFLIVVRYEYLRCSAISVDRVLSVVQAEFAGHSTLRKSTGGALIRSIRPARFSAGVSSRPVGVIDKDDAPFPVPRGNYGVRVRRACPSGTYERVPCGGT